MPFIDRLLQGQFKKVHGDVISRQSCNSSLFPLLSGPICNRPHLPTPTHTPHTHQLLELVFLILSANSASNNLIFFLYASRNRTKAKEYVQFHGEQAISRWFQDNRPARDRKILLSPAAVRAHYESAELKTAQDNTKSDLDSVAIIPLRKRTELGTTGHIKNIHKQGQLIPSGKCGERKEYLTGSSDLGRFVCVHKCIFLETVRNCHQNLKRASEPSIRKFIETIKHLPFPFPLPLPRKVRTIRKLGQMGNNTQ